MFGDGNFDIAKIFACTIFGAVGFIAFAVGKKNVSWRSMVIGIALMGYPYFVSGALATYGIGVALVAALYFWRDR